MIFQRKNNILYFAIAAALAGGAGTANAALVDDAFATRTAPNVASETPITGIILTNNAGSLTAGGSLTSFLPSDGQNLMVNVTLDNGAKFGATNPTLNCKTVNGDLASGFAKTLGGAGTNNVVFSLSSTTAGLNAQTSAAGGTAFSSTGCYVSATDVTVTGAHNAVGMSITYTYGTLASSTINGTYISFASGLKTSAALGNNAVAQVGSGFVTLTGAATTLSAGTISWRTAASAGVTGDFTAVFNLSDALGATSGSITVAGASLAATKVTGGVWLANGICGSAGDAASQATAAGGVTPITFSGLTPTLMSAGLAVCMTFNGTTAIPAGSITAQVGGTAITGHSLPSNAATTLMEITRNGTTLVAPLVNVPSGWISRLVLTNRGSSAAAYTVSAVSETGTTVTLTGEAASGSIAASSTTVVDLATLMTTVGNARGSLQVTIGGSNSNIDGLYQLVNAATGNLSNYTLISK